MTAPALDRLIFKTSRLAEFCSQRELINQTGHGVDDWPLVVFKEVVDNALDACEEADIAPVVEMRAIARPNSMPKSHRMVCDKVISAIAFARASA